MRIIYIVLLISILFSCTSKDNTYKEVSYHFFRQNGKIGIVDSRGEVTCEPKFDGEFFFPSEFNNDKRSKFTTIYDDKKYRNVIIDIYGNEPFPNFPINYPNEGNLAKYYDDFVENKGLHILSLATKEEIGYYENRVAINFYGRAIGFYSILDQKAWMLFNELGDKIYEERYPLDVDILEVDNKFEAIVLSHRSKEIRYINSKGTEITLSKSMQSRFKRLKEQKEIDDKKESPNYQYRTIPSAEYSDKISNFEIEGGIKYESGEELYFVSKNEKQGVINAEGKILLEIEYDKVKSNYKMLFFYKNDKIGMARLNGEIIYQPHFKAIRYEPNNSKYIDLLYNEYWFEADTNGRIFKPNYIDID